MSFCIVLTVAMVSMPTTELSEHCVIACTGKVASKTLLSDWRIAQVWLRRCYQVSQRNKLTSFSKLPRASETHAFQAFSLTMVSGLVSYVLLSLADIDRSKNAIRAVVKATREAQAAFTSGTAALLQERPVTNGYDTLFGMKGMLTRLSGRAGFPCNAHSFRRGFACLL
jgi:hypothetical protein